MRLKFCRCPHSCARRALLDEATRWHMAAVTAAVLAELLRSEWMALVCALLSWMAWAWLAAYRIVRDWHETA